MVLRLARTGGIVAAHVEVARTLRARTRGLLGRRVVPDGYALVIVPCRSIHTCFMSCTIDVVFVDRDNEIVRVVPEVVPYRLAFGGRRAHKVVELGAGRAAGLRAGDRLVMSDEA